MIYVNTSSTADPRTVPIGDGQRDGLKPDIITYHSSHPSVPDAPITDFTRGDRVDELKPDVSWDPFDDTAANTRRDLKFPFEAQSGQGRKTRGAICMYANGVMQLQFRFFCFSVVYMKTHARLIRWDRSGAIVTEAFEVKKNKYLEEFLWRYAYMNRAQRGFDDSVQPVREPKSDELREAYEKLTLEEEKRNPGRREAYADRILYRLHMDPLPIKGNERSVPQYPAVGHQKQPAVWFRAAEDTQSNDKDANSDKSVEKPDNESGDSDGKLKKRRKSTGNYLLLGPRTIFDRSPFAKATRSFIVLHEPTGDLFHLKDTHRVPTDEYTPEHEILEDLRKKGVRRIPTVECAWDVSPYGTSYDTVFSTMFVMFNKGKLESKDVRVMRGAMRILRPYRQITREVAYDVSTFKSWKQVSEVIYDTLGGASIQPIDRLLCAGSGRGVR